jgi:hypothetical protein
LEIAGISPEIKLDEQLEMGGSVTERTLQGSALVYREPGYTQQFRT